MKAEPPGDDVCPTPPPVDEDPPHDRFCDLVLTGGVASGVVYPWAIVELARAYRFRNIGGSSVGAMAAALAAAAEYGRRNGHANAFEVLRRLPGALGTELDDGRTRMLSLFQPAPHGQRLLRLWAALFKGTASSGDEPAAVGRKGTADPTQRTPASGQPAAETSVASKAATVASAYFVPIGLGVIAGQLVAWALTWPPGWRALVVMLLLALGGAVVGFVVAVWRDVQRGIVDNNLGLCTGGTLEPGNPGLTEWLHEGIQRSAGLALLDPPLTFGDLWRAPMAPGAAPTRCNIDDPPQRRAIDLQVVTTNVTHGRPYRLPLNDSTSRLFFRRADLVPYLPATVLEALVNASKPYAPSTRFRSSDPPADNRTEGYFELPGAELPIVVAARLSLSFPLLFSVVPLYAIDYEIKNPAERVLRRCLFTDGGVSSNFPIHIFDAALPRWPTFGLWLDREGPYQRLDDAAPVWLPERHLRGWSDGWARFDPAAAGDEVSERRSRRRGWRRHRRLGPAGSVPIDAPALGGFLLALLDTAKDWRDRTAFRMPHVRTRVARMWLKKDEGGLNIGMSRRQILDMANRYGTRAGQLFVERFCGDGVTEAPAWREQRWVRLQLLFTSVRERLDGLSASVAHASHCVPMRQAIDEALTHPPLRENKAKDDRKLEPAEADSLRDLLAELERLERVLGAATPQHYKPTPEPELRLRAPL